MDPILASAIVAIASTIAGFIGAILGNRQAMRRMAVVEAPVATAGAYKEKAQGEKTLSEAWQIYVDNLQKNHLAEREEARKDNKELTDRIDVLTRAMATVQADLGQAMKTIDAMEQEKRTNQRVITEQSAEISRLKETVDTLLEEKRRRSTQTKE